ncbi:PH domain-containing protein [Ihubacter sp. rT4E-8]|uniref:PH domain-containing protein n=1 Tax=unclassified Ihubacter TaxID=2633299 RepID=UPI00137A34CD
MEYQQPDVRAMKSWRIGRLISFAVFAIIAAVVILIIWCTGWSSWWRYIIIGGAVLMAVVQGVAACILPQIEYRQWGYLIEEDKVVIRHGIFFIKKTIVPIIRIQNITMSQGPIDRRLGLYKLKLSLASGSFEIVGLNQETAEAISENLKSRLYARVREKGVL